MLNTRETTAQHYKNRVKNCLPIDKDVRKQLYELYPEFKEKKNRTKLNNVLALRSSDIRLTEIIEVLTKKKLSHNSKVAA